MQNYYTRRLRRPFTLLGVALVCSQQPLPAQVAPNTPDQQPPVDQRTDKMSEPPVILNPFVVQGDSNKGYKSTNSASAIHMNVPISNIPADISIINSTLMKDIGAFDFRNALQYTPGVTMRVNTWDGLVIYGFTTVFSYTNGMSSLPSGNITYTGDMSYVDRIEIIKGPAAAIGGTSAAAGYANKVTKQPTARDFTDVDMTIASYNYYRFTVDSGGTVYSDPNQSVMYRLVGAYTNGEGERQNMAYKVSSIYPAVTWQIGNSTTLTAEAILMDSKTPDDFGPVFYPGNPVLDPAAVPPKFDYAHSFWMDKQFDQNLPGQANLERPVDVYFNAVHSFDEHISVRNIFNYREVYQKLDRSAGTNSPPINGTVPTGIAQQSVMYIDPNTGFLMLAANRNYSTTQTRVINDQLEANFDFTVWGDHTKTNIGAIYTAAENTIRTATVAQPPLNLTLAQNGPDYVYPALPPILAWASQLKNHYAPTKAFFFNHQSYLFDDRFIVTLGGRWDYGTTFTQTNLVTGAVKVNAPTNTIFSKIGAVMYKPKPWLGVYATYSYVGAPVQYLPLYFQAPIDAPGNRLLAFESNTLNRSYGLKADLLKDRLAVTLTHFDVVAENVPLSAAVAGVPGGAQQFLIPQSSIGWDLTVNGQVTDHIEVTGGYVYDATRTALGQQIRGVPLHKGQLYVKYSFEGANHTNWNLRAGCVSESDQWGFSGVGPLNNTFRFPGGTMFDLGAGFTNRQGWSVDFVARNITDVPFPEADAAVYSNTNAPRRTFILTFARHW